MSVNPRKMFQGVGKSGNLRGMTAMPQDTEGPRSLSQIAGRRIRGLRSEHGLSQAALLRRTPLRLSHGALSERETGFKPVPMDELPHFAAALGVSVAYLMGLTDDRSRPLEEAASEFVRHVGLEPTTRCFRVTTGDELADVVDIRPWILHRRRAVEQSQVQPHLAPVINLRSAS